jgi:hypothetical protein
MNTPAVGKSEEKIDPTMTEDGSTHHDESVGNSPSDEFQI